jgi:hypothetical protein
MFRSKSTSPRLLLILAIFLVLGPAQARPIQLPSWLTNVLPEKGATLADEIKCYSLPYGGIGFTSHVLTYWTILVLGFGRKPYWPWSRLSAGKFDLCLAITQVVVTVAIAAFTIARCRSRWQFILLAVWKLVMSMVVGVWGISASRNAIKASKYQLLAKPQSGFGLDEPRFLRPNVGADPPPSYQKDDPGYKAPRIWSLHDGTWLTLLIYGAAAVVGLVGLISLVVENFWTPGVWKITTVFGSLILGTGLAFLALWSYVDVSGALLWGLGFSSLGVIPFLMLILAAFYSDWVLGALAGSLVGVPSGDNAYLYWVKYKSFSAWRLPANWMPRHTLQRNGYPSSLRDLELYVPLCIVGVNFDEMSLCTALSGLEE